MTGHRALTLTSYTDREARRDEEASAPIYNYARFLPWIANIEHIISMLHAAADNAEAHRAVDPHARWTPGNRDLSVADENRRGTRDQVCRYTQPVDRSRRKGGLDPDFMSRFSVAAALALFLQWGTVGGAIVSLVRLPRYISTAALTQADILLVVHSSRWPRLSKRLIHHLRGSWNARVGNDGYVFLPLLLLRRHRFDCNPAYTHFKGPNVGRAVGWRCGDGNTRLVRGFRIRLRPQHSQAILGCPSVRFQPKLTFPQDLRNNSTRRRQDVYLFATTRKVHGSVQRCLDRPFVYFPVQQLLRRMLVQLERPGSWQGGGLLRH
jgi:hypothetical protein